MNAMDFAVFPRNSAPSFRVTITQARLNRLPYWCRMGKLSANCILTGGERGGVAFSKSGEKIPRPYLFKVAVSFFHFVQWLAQGRSKILPCWCRMEKLSASCFLSCGGNRANHCPSSETRFVVSVASGCGRFLAKFAGGVRRFLPESQQCQK